MARGRSREGNGEKPKNGKGGPEPTREDGNGSSELEVLALRLALVEARSRTLRRVSAGALGLACVAALVAAAALLAPYNALLRLQLDRALRQSDGVASSKAIVEAERLVLRGREGEMRGEIALGDDGAVALSLFDKGGKARASLVAEAEGGAALTLAGDEGQPGLVLTGRSLRFADREGGAFLTSTSLGLTAWNVQDARSGVWLGARPDGTSALTLADRKGRTRAGVGLKADGSPTLTLYDREGKTGAVLDVPADGARLGLFSEGVARAGLGHDSTGSQISLYGKDGADRVSLRDLTDGSTGLFLGDQEGKERVAMGVRPNGTTGLSLIDRKGTHRAGLSVLPDDSPHLMLFDAGGGRRVNLGLSAAGLPGLQLEDGGRPQAVLGASAEGKVRGSGPASFVLFDKDGSILFQAPIL